VRESESANRQKVVTLDMNSRRVLTATLAFIVLWCGCERKQAANPAEAANPVAGEDVIRLDPALDALVPRSAHLEKLADGFQFVEGPLWFRAGYLWFSDVKGNVVRQWSPEGGVTEILRPGGYDGLTPSSDGFIGPNGMTHDKDGGVLLCQHGNRQIVRISKDRKVSVLVNRYLGRRLNSPNDLVFRSDGALYFTDPPYGLPKEDEDPAKELKFNGVFRLASGKLEPVIRDLTRPNGIAFSPDGAVLYISNSDVNHKVWMRYDVQPDGTVSNGHVFFDATADKGNGLPDGMKVDAAGNLYCAGPGGIWIFSRDGKHLGTIKTPDPPSNCNWGDDGKTLYITAVTTLYRIKLSVSGEKPLYE
jgi:gluconolactonase